MTTQHPGPDQRQDPIEFAETYDGAGGDAWGTPPGQPKRRPSPHPRHRDDAVSRDTAAVLGPAVSNDPAPWSIGDGGRAIVEVVPVLRDPGEGPDTIIDSGTVGNVHLLAASVRGLSHQENGTPRQDSYGFAVTPDKQWLVAVVADGVSSGYLSHKAAQLVARHAPAAVLAELAANPGLEPGHIDWYTVFNAMARRIIAVGTKLLADDGVAEPTPQDVSEAMATTATIAVVEISPPDHQRHVALAWLGDSPAWVMDTGGWDCLTEVKNAGREIASSSVTALPRIPSDATMLPQWRGYVPLNGTLLLMTDGVGDPLGAADGEVAAALFEVWRDPPHMFEFAKQVAFGRKSFDDDRTVVAVWPRTEP